ALLDLLGDRLRRVVVMRRAFAHRLVGHETRRPVGGRGRECGLDGGIGLGRIDLRLLCLRGGGWEHESGGGGGNTHGAAPERRSRPGAGISAPLAWFTRKAISATLTSDPSSSSGMRICQ